uniref:Uncharacterized protein n=3 Tax=Avena sativa TaxID=4498 RepID=A0ACD5TAZ5_AVESA
MLHLRRCILTRLLSSPAASPIPFPLHRLISAAAPAVSPNPSFAVEDYLVGTCGLTRAQALKASTKISHLKSPSRPDAVLAFLTGLGLSGADVAALVAKDPLFLCAGVEKTLASNVAGLTDLGLSRTDIARLVSLAPHSFRCKSIVSNLPYYLSLFGSYENLLRVIKPNPGILNSSLEKVVKPNLAILRECGLGACHISKLCMLVPRLLNSKQERIQEMVACAEGLGVPRGSAMFRHVLHAVGFRSRETLAAKVDNLKKTLRWSDAEVGIALSKAPCLLVKSKDMLLLRTEFLFSEVGLQPAFIAHCPAMLNYSLEGRLKPRYYAVKFLKQNGLLKCDPSYYSVVAATEKAFVKKYICPHEEAAPHLAEDYVAACRGKLPANFIFT